MTRTRPLPRTFEPRDAALVAVLGAAHAGPVSPEQVIHSARDLGDGAWDPTADTIVQAFRRALKEDLIRTPARHSESEETFEVTDAGIARLQDLLQRPTPDCGALGRTCIAMKLAFAMCLGAAERRLVLEEIQTHYQGEIRKRRNSCASCPRLRQATSLWQDHVIRRIEWELSCLQDLWPVQDDNENVTH